MRLRGYQLTRYADDWVITCKSAAEARAAVDVAHRILKQLGVELHPQKTRIVHVRYGFEFLGYKIKRGYRKLHLPESKIRSQARQDALYAYPKAKSIRRFMDQVRQRTKRTMPLQTKELIEELNQLLRGGASITNAPTSESSSNDSTAGSGGASGRIATNVGAMRAGNDCPRHSFTASTSLSV
jgi:RNA-directed DNA polymerase